MQEIDYLQAANSEPIPGYRLIQPLGRGGFGEVWKCEAPGGLLKAIKFVHGGLHVLDDNAPADEELRAIQRVKTIRHPFFLTMERVEVGSGGLIIVMELADKSLGDVLDDARRQGKPGIPRDQLLNYLREAAEVLDLMNSRHGLQHLDIKPRNLFLVCDHVKVGDFGLVSSLAAPGTKQGSPELGAITPLYASPEVFKGSISPHSDQYSLAIVYQELLTGTLPYSGKNTRQLLVQHLQGEPDLTALSGTDRAVVARALSKTPTDRFVSCSDFVQALVAGQPESVTATTVFLSETKPTQETRTTRSAKTTRTRIVCAPPMPSGENKVALGLKFGELTNATPLTETWSARAADGSPRIVKVLFRCPKPGDEGVARLSTLRHPALLPIEILQHTPGRLVLASRPGEGTLRDLLQEAQGQGHRGIPRVRLLELLRPVAAGLEAMQREFDLQHLGLNPRVLAVEEDRLLAADFGVAQLVWRPTGQPLAPLNGRYCAPELHANQVSPTCDVYSLALIYHEMLTGILPCLIRRQGEPIVPNLDRLSEAERPLIARALDPDPSRRWRSAVELIEALEELEGDTAAGTKRPVSPTRRLLGIPTKGEADEVMRTRFGTALAGDLIRERLEGFRKQWNADAVGDDNGHVVFRMEAPRTFWQRWTGQQPGLEVHLHLATQQFATPAGDQTRTEVHMDVKPRQCPAGKAAELLQGIGPLLVESMRTHLQVNPCGRKQERIVWHHQLQVRARRPDGSLGPAVECQGKDISLNGIGFYLPGELPGKDVVLYLPTTAQTPQSTMSARIVRARGCGDGWHEVGAVLLPPDELPPDEDEA